MKYTLSEDRVVVVKKVQGQLTVTVKQKDSDVKYAEFTPNRYFLLRRRLLIILLLTSV